MEITVSGRHLDVTNETKEYLTTKLSEILASKSLKVSSVRVILSLEKTRYKSEIVVNIKQLDVEAVAETYDLYESIDSTLDKINKQIKKYIDKKQDHHKNPSMRDTIKAINMDLEKEAEAEADSEEEL